MVPGLPAVSAEQVLSVVSAGTSLYANLATMTSLLARSVHQQIARLRDVWPHRTGGCRRKEIPLATALTHISHHLSTHLSTPPHPLLPSIAIARPCEDLCTLEGSCPHFWRVYPRHRLLLRLWQWAAASSRINPSEADWNQHRATVPTYPQVVCGKGAGVWKSRGCQMRWACHERHNASTSASSVNGAGARPSATRTTVS